MTRRRKIQLISVIAAALIALIGTTISGYVLAGRYRTDLEYGYRRAFNDLSEHVTGMENALNKVTYADAPTQQHGITALLMKEASSARHAWQCFLWAVIPWIRFKNSWLRWRTSPPLFPPRFPPEKP